MNVEQEHSRSLWMDVASPEFPPLSGDAEIDVLVIGGGIAGLSCAYELVAAGRRVKVVDRGRLARGMTARTSAHLSFASDDYFHALIRMHGLDGARHWYESQSAAVDRIEAICREGAIDCDFARLDGLLVPAKDDDVENLRKDLEAAREAGFADAEWLKAGARPGLDTVAVRYPRQGRFHPVKYLNGLMQALQGRGVGLHGYTDVASLQERDGWVTAMAGDQATIRARQVIVATNTPFHLKIPIHTKQAPYRTYVIAAPVPKGAVEDVLLWDTAEPGYHYVRIQPGDGQDMLIVGGEDHKSGTEDGGAERIARLEAWTRERYPMAGATAYAWSGQVYEPADAVGFIGRSPQHEEVYLVTGDSGQGLTTGVAASLLLRDLMGGAENPWANLYEPSRQMHRGLGAYVKENVEAAKHWVELIAKREADSVDDIAAGDGALVRLDGKPVAAYRDDAGELHLHSAVCTHAGCVVHWNGFERCWDCPCHGSQFGTDGAVLNGPAANPLAAVADPEADERGSAADVQPDERAARP